MNFLKAVLLVLVLALVAGGVFVASGLYQIGADEPHWDITAKAIGVLRNRSIEAHAKGITVPNIDDPKLVAEGAEHYDAMCTGCHLAPGRKDTEMRAGLYPMPPNLAKHALRDPAKAFWIIKHGIKLTAMPAWGKTHSDEKIWNLVAFLKKLPELSPEQYQAMVRAASSEDHEHGHEHDAQEHDHSGPANPSS